MKQILKIEISRAFRTKGMLFSLIGGCVLFCAAYSSNTRFQHIRHFCKEHLNSTNLDSSECGGHMDSRKWI